MENLYNLYNLNNIRLLIKNQTYYLILGKNLVHPVLFPPDKGRGQHLPSLFHVKVSGPEEPEHHRVRGSLVLLQLGHALLELDETGLLHRLQLAEKHLYVVLL